MRIALDFSLLSTTNTSLFFASFTSSISSTEFTGPLFTSPPPKATAYD